MASSIETIEIPVRMWPIKQIKYAWIKLRFKVDDDNCKIEFKDCHMTGVTSILVYGEEAICTPCFPEVKVINDQKQHCQSVEVVLIATIGLALGKFGNIGVRYTLWKGTRTLCIKCAGKC
ncbi:hypothetical protein ACFLUB_02095 [Chloroflexota bacterium]